MKEAIVNCFAALTEKLEVARSDFVVNAEAVKGLIAVLGSEPQLTTLQLAAFDLLRSLGRAQLAKKKILRSEFHEMKVNFVDRVCKQFIMCSAPEQTTDFELAIKMQTTVLRVINNFGLDFKQFIEYQEVVAEIMRLVVQSKSPAVQRVAIMTLKNLNFETSLSERSSLEKNMTGDFLLGVLKAQEQLRDQVLLIIKQMFRRLESFKTGSLELTDNICFLSSPLKVTQFMALIASVFNEADEALA